MTDDQIVEVARRKGVFKVSLRYRDDRLREQCRRLVKQGKLKRGGHWKQYGECAHYFLPIDAAFGG